MKALIWVLAILLFNLVLILLLGIFVIGGLIPTLIVSAVIVGPIQNRIANGRRANPAFTPVVRGTVAYVDVTKAEVKGKSLKLKGEGLEFAFKMTEAQKNNVVPLLQQKLNSGVLKVK